MPDSTTLRAGGALAFWLLSATLAGCGHSPLPIMGIVSNPTHGYTCLYAQDWKKTETDGLIMLDRSPTEARMLVLNVGQVSIPGGVTASGDIAVLAPQCAQSFQNGGASAVASEPTTLGGLAAYRFTMKRQIAGMDTRQWVVLALHHSRFYAVQYIASPELYDANLPQAQALADSFRFL